MPKGAQTHRQNHLERHELLKKNKMAAGLVSERFPGVSQIVLHLTYYQRGIHPILMVRTLTFIPADYAYFHMDCMRDECENGGFDLTSIVSGVIKDGKKSVQGKIACCGKNAALGSNHASIGYKVSIQN